MKFVRELPLVWFLLGSAFAILGVRAASRLPSTRRAAVLRCLAMAAGLLTIAIFAAMALISMRDYMLVYDEADILGIAAATAHGQPMYHSMQSPDYSYALRYGPYVFLIYQAGLLLAHGSFAVLRAMPTLAVVLAFLVAYLLMRRFLSPAAALALTALPLCMLLQHPEMILGLRSDAWLLLVLMLAMRFTLLRREWVAAVLCGLCIGVAVDLKATAVLGSALVLMALYQRGGARLPALAAAVGAVTALAPFALPNVSVVNYIAWLRAAQGEGLDPGMLRHSVAFAIFFVLPLLLLKVAGIKPFPFTTGRRLWAATLLFGACVVLVASVAGKPGTGTYHFWQLIPALMLYLAVALGAAQQDHPHRVEQVVLMIAFGGALVGLTYVARDFGNLRPRLSERQQVLLGRQEIDAYMAAYNGRTLQVGYGYFNDETVSTLRYIPVLRGQPYTLDGSGRLEVFSQKFPSGVLQKMNTCSSDVWLIPHNQPPFRSEIFPQSLRDAFVQNYAIQQRGQLLDAWVCKAK